jgi:transposase
MYIASVPNRDSPPAILLRESYRDGGKVKTRTLANLSAWPSAQVDALRAVLKGKGVATAFDASFEIVRSLPHGHVAAVVGTLRRLGLMELLERNGSRSRDLCEALIAARVIDPKSKLATATGLGAAQETSLAEVLELGPVDEDDLYRALDWLLERQSAVEDRLAKRHLVDGELVLYDVTSTYFEGRHCPLAKLGYSRDGQPHRPQIVIGLLTNSAGCPVAIEVFEGNTGDPSTVSSQIEKLRKRFGLKRVVFVGDRGMVTSARIREDLVPNPIDWISALRAADIAGLVDRGSLQLSLFDERDLAEIEDPEFPNERLVVCHNPLLADERARKRKELLAATELKLQSLADATQRAARPLRGEKEIARRVGRIEARSKVTKHFTWEITDTSFTFKRDDVRIAAETARDGIYVLRTSVSAKRLTTTDIVASYKSLAHVERAFRSMKTTEIELRPIHHRKPERVRAHVFLCMLAYYVEWHMRQALAPILFQDDDRKAAAKARKSIVAPAKRSPRAERKAATKITDDGIRVASFRSWLVGLATITRNDVAAAGLPAFVKITRPSPAQSRAFELLNVRL